MQYFPPGSVKKVTNGSTGSDQDLDIQTNYFIK